MKANVPEKIYRTTTYLNNQGGQTMWKRQPVAGAENIEYIRKDAFIEKACEWLADNARAFDEGDIYNAEDLVEHFRKYMKGE